MTSARTAALAAGLMLLAKSAPARAEVPAFVIERHDDARRVTRGNAFIARDWRPTSGSQSGLVLVTALHVLLPPAEARAGSRTSIEVYRQPTCSRTEPPPSSQEHGGSITDAWEVSTEHDLAVYRLRAGDPILAPWRDARRAPEHAYALDRFARMGFDPAVRDLRGRLDAARDVVILGGYGAGLRSLCAGIEGTGPRQFTVDQIAEALANVNAFRPPDGRTVSKRDYQGYMSSATRVLTYSAEAPGLSGAAVIAGGRDDVVLGIHDGGAERPDAQGWAVLFVSTPTLAAFDPAMPATLVVDKPKLAQSFDELPARVDELGRPIFQTVRRRQASLGLRLGWEPRALTDGEPDLSPALSAFTEIIIFDPTRRRFSLGLRGTAGGRWMRFGERYLAPGAQARVIEEHSDRVFATFAEATIEARLWRYARFVASVEAGLRATLPLTDAQVLVWSVPMRGRITYAYWHPFRVGLEVGAVYETTDAVTRQYTGVGAGTTAASADLGYWRYSLGLLFEYTFGGPS